MASNSSSTQVIYAALSGNLLVAFTKAGATAWTGSSAMLSEAIHSFVDIGNQVLLYGMRRAKLQADPDHSIGYGRELYFWSFIVALLVFALGAVVSICHGILHMSKVDYKATKARISADYKTDKTVCAALAANAKDICVEEAKAKEKVGYAELEYADLGKAADPNKVLVAKADTAYAVAKERSDDKAGSDKDVCVKAAKAVQLKALANARMGKQIRATKKDASEDKRDADYKVALEKCNALTVDLNAACIAAAKVKFEKS